MILSQTALLIVCGLLLLLAVGTSFMSPFVRRPRLVPPEPGSRPRFSIVVCGHNNAAELDRNLPAFLTQQYEPGYEVIVVNESSTDDTEDVLTRLQTAYPHLYTTFLPKDSHYVSRRKLALTIGIKAAHNEWVVICSPDSYPETDNWLNTLAKYCADSTRLACCFTGYAADAPAYYTFERLLMACHHMRFPYRYEGGGLAIRKPLFMQHNGFIRNLKYLRGELDFLMNEYGDKDSIAVIDEPEGRMRQDAPTQRSWYNKHLFYMETRRHLQHTLLPRLLFNTDQTALHLNCLIQLSALVYAAVFTNYVLLGTAIAAIILSVGLRTFMVKKTVRQLDANLPVWKIPFLELRVVWQNG